MAQKCNLLEKTKNIARQMQQTNYHDKMNSNSIERSSPSICMNMIHSEEELRHGLQHLLQDGLDGHETMTLYRNVRSKYARNEQEKNEVKNKLRGVEHFRTVEDGILAAYRSSVCESGPIRHCSALYVNINPRNVMDGLKVTYSNFLRWVEYKAGLTTDAVKGADKEDYAGRLDKALNMNVLKTQSKRRFDMIDVDEKDPDTWLRRICEAIDGGGGAASAGSHAIELIVETKNGYHVVYKPRNMTRESHVALHKVLSDENAGSGSDCKVLKVLGGSVSCALPGGYQADHKTRILYCSCQKEKGWGIKSSR